METREAENRESRAAGRRPPALVLLVGLPGTGKSHLARLLAARLPVEVVETDEIRRRISGRPTYSRAESGRVYATAHRQIDRLLRDGRHVVFDATNLYERGRRTLYRIAERSGARLLIVRTTAPEQVVEERLRRRARGAEPADRSEAGWEVYCRMKGEYQEIKRPHLVVDTSLELEPVLAQIVDFVLDGDESASYPQPPIGPA